MKRKRAVDILKLLAGDKDESVRNAKTPVEVSEVLMDDPAEEVAEAAAARLAQE